MEQELFHHAKLKVKRSDQHIFDLNKALNAFLKTDFSHIYTERDADTGGYILKQSVDAIPEDTSLILGDAVHNLRTALDYLVWNLVLICGTTPTNRISFPICETRQKLVDALKDPEIKTVGNNIIVLIRDVVKPYKGGNDLLWNLHQLDIVDKHRLPIAVSAVTELTGVTGHTGSNRLNNCTLRVTGFGSASLIGAPENFEIEDQGKPTFTVLFTEPEGFKGKAVVPTLHSVSQVVSDVIQDIENGYRLTHT